MELIHEQDMSGRCSWSMLLKDICCISLCGSKYFCMVRIYVLVAWIRVVIASMREGSSWMIEQTPRKLAILRETGGFDKKSKTRFKYIWNWANDVSSKCWKGTTCWLLAMNGYYSGWTLRNKKCKNIIETWTHLHLFCTFERCKHSTNFWSARKRLWNHRIC